MVLDWSKLESENKSQYKPYAEEGIHTTTIDSVELIASKVKGTPGIKIHFADNDDYAFPKIGMTIWLGEKVAWFSRPVYMKHLLMALGLAETSAQEEVEKCEEKSGDDRNKAYQAVIERTAKKCKEVSVAVYREQASDKYPKIDFADPKVRIGRPRKATESASVDDMFGDSKEESISESNIPF